MSELLHRIKVFVFQRHGPEPAYLLLKPNQGVESCWGPLHGSLGFGEKLDHAIRREVLNDVGLLKPLDVIDLGSPVRWILGDEDVIEWCFGFRVPAEDSAIKLDRRWAEFRWAQFHAAYPSLELDTDRAAILRLHTLVRAA